MGKMGQANPPNTSCECFYCEDKVNYRFNCRTSLPCVENYFEFFVPLSICPILRACNILTGTLVVCLCRTVEKVWCVGMLYFDVIYFRFGVLAYCIVMLSILDLVC